MLETTQPGVEDTDASDAAEVRASIDRLSAWAPDTARRARTALESGLTGQAETAAECVRALVLPPNAPEGIEGDRGVVLAALQVAARPVDPMRAGYIQGLRKLADLLEQHPDLPLPYEGSSGAMAFQFLFGPDPKAAMVAASRVLHVRLDKDVVESEYGSYFNLRGHLAGLQIRLVAFRDAVCRKVQVGEEEITEEVPDPEALAAVPTVTVTRTVPKYDWECQPILAGAADTALDGAA